MNIRKRTLIPFQGSNRQKNTMVAAERGGLPGFTPKAVQEFNQKTMAVQGYRLQFTAPGTLPYSPVLNGGGIYLYGLSVTTATPADLGDTQLSFTVNNLSYLVDVPVSQIIPNYVQGFLYTPVPTPLTGGKDTFKVQFTKNNAGAVTFFLNLFYLPNPQN